MSHSHSSDPRQRWRALIVLCLGVLMIVLDGTVVNVALPSIKDNLQFNDTNLAWVVNAYLLTFGGFLLLGGRLGDLYGHRRLFTLGLAAFTLASLACGLASLFVLQSDPEIASALPKALSTDSRVKLLAKEPS